MNLANEQLENKWWHRLVKVLIRVTSIAVLLFWWGYAIEETSFFDYSFFIVIFLTLVASITTFFLLKIFYYKIILYIIYGKASFDLRIIEFTKKQKRLLIYLIIFSLIIGLSLIGLTWYSNMKERKFLEQPQQKEFRNAEIAYQKCLDKVASVDKSYCSFAEFKKSGCTPGGYKYFDEWKSAGSPNYIQSQGHWEWGFMEWMMKKYPEFCTEYDINLINYFLEKKEVMILKILEIPTRH